MGGSKLGFFQRKFDNKISRCPSSQNKPRSLSCFYASLQVSMTIMLCALDSLDSFKAAASPLKQTKKRKGNMPLT